MLISNRSDFRHCSRKCRCNRLEPPCTDPYARWCGRGRRATAAPMPIKRGLRKVDLVGPVRPGQWNETPLFEEVAERSCPRPFLVMPYISIARFPAT